MVTIISTHPVTVRYNMWRENPEMHSKERIWDCTIKGGAGIALGKGDLVVHDGVATEVTEEALEKLRQIPAFITDEKEGFIKVLENTKKKSVDADDEALKDMNTEGTGKQLTDKELEEDGAEVNSDGSIDVTHGGKNAILKRNLKHSEESDEEVTTTKKKRGRK